MVARTGSMANVSILQKPWDNRWKIKELSGGALTVSKMLKPRQKIQTRYKKKTVNLVYENQ